MLLIAPRANVGSRGSSSSPRTRAPFGETTPSASSASRPPSGSSATRSRSPPSPRRTCSSAARAGRARSSRARHTRCRRARPSPSSRATPRLSRRADRRRALRKRKELSQPRMAERPGLIGQASGGTLFLDEIGSCRVTCRPISSACVLDDGGEYQRLGEATTREERSSRLIGADEPRALVVEARSARATRRPRRDAAFLEARREDIPLFVRHLLAQTAKPARDRREVRGARRGAARAARRLPRSSTRGSGVDTRRTSASSSLSSERWRRARPTWSCRDWVGAKARPQEEPASRSEPRADRRCDPRGIYREDGNVRCAARALGLLSRYALTAWMRKHVRHRERRVCLGGAPRPEKNSSQSAIHSATASEAWKAVITSPAEPPTLRAIRRQCSYTVASAHKTLAISLVIPPVE